MAKTLPPEFKTKSFLDAVKAAKNTLGYPETGLSAQSEFDLHVNTGKVINTKKLIDRTENVNLKHSKIRSVYWKIFLSYVGSDTSQWKSELQQKRDNYDALYAEYINKKPGTKESDNLLIDNPLSAAQGTSWSEYFEGSELRETIDLDIQRTYPEHEFFIHEIIQKKLINILYIWCKENKWIGYKQGMNELIAPLFMVNVVQSTISVISDENNSDNITDLNENNNNNDNNNEMENEINDELTLWECIQDIRYLEHDTYYIFSEIMKVMADYFANRNNDKTPPVVKRLQRVQGQYVRQIDAQLGQQLIKANIQPQLYGLKWVRLFFTREFHLRDALLIWDSIFASYFQRKAEKLKIDMQNIDDNNETKTIDDPLSNPPKKISQKTKKSIKLDFRFVDYMCVSMLLYIRQQLINKDEHHILRRIMKYPPVEDISIIIKKAYTIRDHIERKGKFQKNKLKGKQLSNMMNRNSSTFSDRWNNFNSSVSTAITSYAKDVESLMITKSRTLQTRMDFEQALGNKMTSLLKTLQSSIFIRRDLLIKAKQESINNNNNNNIIDDDDPLSSNLTKVIDEDPLGGIKKSKKDELKDPIEQIEEALAELKLVKDALLGNLDETQLSSWLNWTFDTKKKSNKNSNNNNTNTIQKNKSNNSINNNNNNESTNNNNNNITLKKHKKQLSSGLPPPKKNLKKKRKRPLPP